MKIIYFLLIFGIIYSSTNLPDKVVDIYYNVEYALSKDLSRQFTYYPFRLPVIAGDKMDIEIKVPNNAKQEFYLEVYEYDYRPNDIQLYDHVNGVSMGKYLASNYYYEGNFTVYYYTFQVSQNATKGSYFSIYLTVPNYDYSSLYFRINLSKYKYSKIKDLKITKNYEIDTSIFEDRKIPYGYQSYIRVSSLRDEQIQIQLATHEDYDKNSSFIVDVCEYNNFPDEALVYYDFGAVNCQTINNTSTKKAEYYYDFQTQKNIQYLSIRIINNIPDLNYLSIYIYADRGEKLTRLICTIFGAVFIVTAAIVLILKNCGIIGDRNTIYVEAPSLK